MFLGKTLPEKAKTRPKTVKIAVVQNSPCNMARFVQYRQYDTVKYTFTPYETSSAKREVSFL
jgi:hypothetical protein